MHKRIPWRTLGLLATLAPLYSQVQLNTIPPLPTEAQSKSIGAPAGDKLDPRLRRLVRDSATKSMTLAASDLGLVTEDSLVSVQLSGAGDTAALESAVTNGGGQIDTTYDGVVYARVPVSLLGALGNSKDLTYAGPQAEYQLLQSVRPGMKVSEGIDASYASLLHSRGIRGRGVKVGIIDGGFKHYPALRAAGRLPQVKRAIAVNKANSMDNGTEHGTGCAEIIYQMAPEAELYLAAVDLTTGPIVKAVQWMLQQGVDVINFSVGSSYRGDGLDELSQIVEESTRKAGVLWLVAAGNEGDAHWMGDSRNVHPDGLLRIGQAGNAIKITARGQVTQLMLRWDDWGANPRVPAARQDLDLYVLARGADGNWANFQHSADPQNGNGMPLEVVRFRSQPGQQYLVLVKASRVNRPVKVHLFTSSVHTGPDPAIEPAIPAGSIGAPALTRAAVAVGAVDVLAHKIAPYSSQGPTDDGRVKPDLAAPTGTTSAAYAQSGGRFHGTSAAAPHATGFAALIKQMQPQARADVLRAAVLRYVRPMGAAAPNNEYGFGHIDGQRVGGQLARRTITLPKGLGGDIDVKAIERVRGDQPSSIRVKVVVGRAEYQVGQGLKVGFTADEDCYYVLLNRDAEGNYSVIAPVTGEAARLNGGEKYALPRGEETLTVSGPGGSEEVILICSRQPIDLNDPNVEGLSVAIAKYEVKPQ